MPERSMDEGPAAIDRERPRPAVNLKHVAQAAGVHVSTASRALDPAKCHLIADDVVARIRKVADDLGYRRDMLAASLRTRRSRLVGVLVPDIANPVFSPIIAGLSEEMRAHGYSVIVADVGADPDRQRALVDELIARRVDGLVLATVRRDDEVLGHCLDQGVPVVLVNRDDETGRVPSVTSDDAAGMKLAVDHLAALGHTRIGHIAGPGHLSTGHGRRLGFVAAMAAHGLPVDDDAVVAAGAYERGAGEAAAAQLIGQRPDLTAIVAANDLLAIGALEAMHAAGRHCPRDVSIVGHNDMPLVDMIDPPLTTVRIGPRRMGAEAARLLIGDLEDEPGPREHLVLQPELVSRGSTARPRTSDA